MWLFFALYSLLGKQADEMLYRTVLLSLAAIWMSDQLV